MAPSSSSSAGATSNRAPMGSRRIDLPALAAETKRKLDWDRLAVLRSDDPRTPQWKWVENARNFSIYTKQVTTGRKGATSFAVLAVGTVKASVNEVASLLVSRSQDELILKMEALYDKEYKDGQYLYDVEIPPSASNDPETPVHMSVRSVTFTKSGGWLSSHDEWCHLDAVYQDRDSQTFERVLTALTPEDAHRKEKKPSNSVKYFRGGVFAAYRIENYRQNSRTDNEASSDLKNSDSSRVISGSKQPFMSRVHFYAEMPLVAHSTIFGALSAAANRGDAPSDKLVKLRLLQMAKGCHRLSLLIRRRRLGVQMLVDRSRFLPPTNTPCFRCGKHLLVAKVCRLCGQGVCKDCSDKYERETRVHDYPYLDCIRVCDPCLDRVESTDYSAVHDVSLGGPRIVPDECEATAAEAELRYLLREALVEAKSPEHKASVMNVIRCVLHDEETLVKAVKKSPPGSGNTTPIRLTPQNSGDFSQALESLHVDPIPYDQAVVRTNEDRSYRMDTRNPEKPVHAPLSESEEDRLRAVAQIDVEQLADSVELNILCDLAATEMGCTMSTIAIFDRDNLNCVAANVESIHKAKLPRANTPCAHTILENKPHLVAHPEADIRFAESEVVKKFGARFYFAFPVVDVSDQIIGSFCVMNDSSMEVTETKYTAFKKLAETCNKVVRIHTEQRRRSSSSSS